MRVLVTGATSLLGHHTVEELLSQGHDVRVLQRGQSGLDVEQFIGDIRDLDLVGKAVRSCDVVLHAAGKVGIIGSYKEFHTVNVQGTKNILQAAHEANCRGIVFVSSPSVAYSKQNIQGQKPGPARNDLLGHYSNTKSLAEQLVLSQTSLPVVAIRPHLVWGPGDTQLVGRVLQRARQGRLVLINAGQAIVDTTYVSNTAQALTAASELIGIKPELAGMALIISNGEPRSVADLMRSICQAGDVTFAPRNISLRTAVALGRVMETIFRLRPQVEPPLTRFLAYQMGLSHWFDISQAKELLSWTPAVSLDRGFELLKQSFS